MPVKRHIVYNWKKIIFHFRLTINHISDILVCYIYVRVFVNTDTTLLLCMFTLLMVAYDMLDSFEHSMALICVDSWLAIINLTCRLEIILIGLDRTHCCAFPDKNLELQHAVFLSLYSVLKVRLNNFFQPTNLSIFCSTDSISTCIAISL